MEEENKLPLKRVELPLSKFNEVAIPHHLDLLRQHKANIIKYESLGEYRRMATEQTHARRVATQLRALLRELEALRAQVRQQDVAAFDARTRRARELTLRAIMDYLGVIERSCIALLKASSTRRSVGSDSSPMAMNRASQDGDTERGVSGSVVSSESVGVVEEQGQEMEQVQLQTDAVRLELEERAAALRGWASLQTEVRALHEAWQHMQAAALAQQQQVNAVSASTEVAADNVETARTHLAVSEKLKAGMYGVGGAVAGALAGGPVGLVLGAKAGAAALLAGSAIGYLGARLLGRRRQAQIDNATAPETPDDKKER